MTFQNNLRTIYNSVARKPQVYFLVILLILCFQSGQVSAQTGVEYINKVYMKHLHSVRMLVGEWETSYPVIEMNSEAGLVFSFDDIEAGQKDFEYTVIHCNSDWKPSNLQFFEYAEGFEYNSIREISSSRNTFVAYTHYSLQLPNEDLQLKYSGNYLLVVYQHDGNEQKIACTWRFIMYENALPVTAGVYQPAGSLYDTGQKLSFVINRTNYSLFDPSRELKVVIMQNNQSYNAISGLQPTFMNNNELVYDYEDKQTFTASNEYRYFSTRNVKVLSERVKSIQFKNPYYYIELFPESPAYFDKYSSREDINGHYVIKSDLHTVIDENTDVDYSMVHIVCNMSRLPDNNKVYVFGALSGWEFSDACEMKYNADLKAYESLLMLKQGYYNYRYVVRTPDGTDQSLFEGSHWATENDYQIFVYHDDISAGYERLVGYTKVNSRNR